MQSYSYPRPLRHSAPWPASRWSRFAGDVSLLRRCSFGASGRCLCEEAGAAEWAIAIVVATLDYASAKVRETVVWGKR